MVRSINEPDTSRLFMLTPVSINEPSALPDPDAPAPVITSLEPVEATIGGPSFRLYVVGTNFFPGSVIVFAGQDEPTTLESDGRLSTGINMDVWHGADVLPVAVRNGDKISNEVDFTFYAAVAGARSGVEAADPDELEEEIEEAEEDGDFKPTHRGFKPTHRSKTKTKR